MTKMNVKKGDEVIVIAGKDKGKQGKVLSASPKNEKVVVEGIGMVKRHTKPRCACSSCYRKRQKNPCLP